MRCLCKEKGISEATFYEWRKKFNGTSTKQVQRLKELEKENSRLKKLLVERDLENDVLKPAQGAPGFQKTGERSPKARDGASAQWERMLFWRSMSFKTQKLMARLS